LANVQAQGHAIQGHEDLSDQTRLIECLIFGLRMNMGVNLPLLEDQANCHLPLPKKQTIDFLIAEGFLTQSQNGQLTTTLKGRLSLDTIAAKLV
jgi:coproporphyrinogen III oxidase-like Fe-S oxidoreductase